MLTTWYQLRYHLFNKEDVVMMYADLMAPKVFISQRLFERVKLSREHAADLAQKAGFSASTMSLILNRRRMVRMNDPRILKLGRLVGLKKDELFERVA